MLTIGGTDGSITSIKNLATEINDHQQKLQKAREDLIELISSKLSIHLISRKTVTDFLDQVSKEQVTRRWHQDCIALKPQREKFLQSFFSHDSYSPPLSDNQKSQLSDAINSAWESLFSPPPANCTEKCIHNYLSDECLNQIHSMYNNSYITINEIHSRFLDVEVIAKRLEAWHKQMAKLEGLDHSGELVERIKRQMDEIKVKSEDCITNLDRTRNKLTSDNAELENIKTEFARENKRFLDNAPTNYLLHTADKISNFIGRLIDELYKLKINQFSEEGGPKLDFDKSAGESQLFATALLSALASISGADAPLIVDTPLGRLDSLHRKNILNFWTQDHSRQVILLSQDEEIDVEQYQKLKPHILKAYTLKHIDMGTGAGQTTAHPGYFGDSNDEA